MTKICSERRGDKPKIYGALKTIVKKLSAISQATSVQNQSIELPGHHSSVMLMKGDAEKEISYSLNIHKSQSSKLCVAFDKESFLSEQRHENETEFSRAVHYSGLYRAGLTQRRSRRIKTASSLSLFASVSASVCRSV